MDTATDDTTPVDMDQVRTYRAWWPAAVVLPPDRTVWHRVRAYATTAGLLIYRQPPSLVTPRWGALTPDWSADIDLADTPVPSQGQLPGQSWSIDTTEGLVVITYVGGCGCGTAIRNWRPSFSTRVAPWPT
jgi:hypothetical protein